jgi:CheY-like chemotaxis protein/HPt (histidine-containing phosphotransfer) domain-containing protein
MASSSSQMHCGQIGTAFDTQRRNRAPKILIAEDNSINAELLAMTARRLGVEIAHAADGEEAVRMAKRARSAGQPFSLMLMDVMMPVMDGLQATRHLRDAGFSAEELPIVAVTAAVSSAEVRAYMAAGMQGCLSKPVPREALKAAFDTWLPHLDRIEGKAAKPHVRSLRERYEQRKAETLELMEAALQVTDLQPETMEEIRNRLHKLAGTAGSFDEEPLSEAATQCEMALIEASPEDWHAMLAESRDRLLKAV